ncbi:MAG: type IX secretion system membrane protein PorP/SprF [Bacteroidetes bacterium]|nr:MAG: type IX secretion system membrane protein PorP/SprF [Bacteroidota bacterium]
MKNQNIRYCFRSTKVLVFALCSLFCAVSSFGQDVHFSNFNYALAMVNPAQAGFFPGHYRWAGLYRSQWSSVPVDYQTLAGGFDMKLRPGFLRDGNLLGAGLFLFQDQAGDASLSNGMVAFQAAFHKLLNDELSLSAGVHASLHHRKADASAVTWESQYNGDQFDPSLFSGESFSSQNGNYISAGAGLQLSYQHADTRSNYSIGLSSYHLNSPVFTFYDDTDVKIKQRINLLVLLTRQVNQTLDAHFNFLFSIQGPYREILTEGLLRKHFSLSAGNTIELFGGVGIRWQDAIYPKIGLKINNTEAGFSYDINFSEWKKASLRKGGPEFFIRHVLWKVEPPAEFKPCPIF